MMMANESVQISSPEAELIPQFKEMLISHNLYKADAHDDFLLARFIKARQGNLDLAFKMFSDSVAWRTENDIDRIHEFKFEEKKKVLSYYPNSFHKTDKLGRPFWITRCHNFDYESIKKISTEDRVMQYHIRENEKNRVYRTVACSQKAGHHIGQSLMVIDLDGMQLMQIYNMMGFIQKLLFVDNSYYPECMGKILVINSGFVFSGIWRCICPLLPKETVAKISILGSNYHSELGSLVDKENLPAFFGGECECEGGCENADIGPWNDLSVPNFPQEKWEFGDQ